MRIFLSRYI